MFDACQKSAGTGYPATVAFLVVAFIVSPSILAISRPLRFTYVLFAIACSMLCVTLAWFNWKRFSQVPVSSSAIPKTAAK